MGRRIVRVSPEFLQELITEGHTIGDGVIVRTMEGIPAGARFLRAWYEGDRSPDGVIVLLFEHESWGDTHDGDVFANVTPMFRSEYAEPAKPFPVWTEAR